MPLIASRIKIFKGQEEEYKRRHDELWPDIEELLHQTGISDYSIFLDESTGDLFAVLQAEDPAKLSDLPNHPVMKSVMSKLEMPLLVSSVINEDEIAPFFSDADLLIRQHEKQVAFIIIEEGMEQ